MPFIKLRRKPVQSDCSPQAPPTAPNNHSELKKGVARAGKRAVLVEATLSLTLILLLTGLYYRVNVAAGYAKDFEHCFAGAHIVRAGMGFRLYDISLVHQFETQYGHGPGFGFSYPAVTALLYWPTTFFDLNHGFLVWDLMSMAVILAALFVLHRTLAPAVDYWWTVLLSLFFLPLHVAQISGQTGAFLLLAYALALAGLKSGRHFTAGCSLGLGLVKFHLVLPFVFVMLMRRQWRFVGGFAVGAFGMLSLSFAVCGTALFSAYPRQLMTVQSGPGFEPWRMPNLRGLLIFVSGRDAPAWLLASITLVVLIWVAGRWRDLENGFSAAMTATFLTSYYGYVHDLLPLIIPLAVMTLHFGQTWRKTAVLATLAIPAIPYACCFYRCAALLALPMFPLLSLFAGSNKVELETRDHSFRRAKELSA